MKWYLDFGHGGKDSGAIGPTNLKESDIALKIGMMVKENLRAKAAYSPAEALLSRLATKPCRGVKPAVRAAMPSEKDTAKYPSAMGTPSRIPSQNTLRLNA